MPPSPVNPDAPDLAALIRGIGFACRRCGACCRPGDGDSGLVFLSHDEVEALVADGAESWDEVAAPYPEFIPCGNGSLVTFGWCIRHENGQCRFLGKEGCTRYSSRPWICRTFPFALVDGELTVSDCPGLGDPVSPEDALLLAEELLGRARFEAEDEERGRVEYARACIPAGRRCVVDASGLRILDD
jgi:Fe-S-cluster containining protein